VAKGDSPLLTVAASAFTAPNALPTGAYPFLSPTGYPGELGRLGSYRVIRLLGEGGMGFVFSAEDDGLLRPVALKVLRPEVAAEPIARERFLREGRAAAAVKSDHVIAIHQVGEANGVPFLAMEYLEGLTLDNWLNTWQRSKQRPVPATAIVRVAKDVLKGLAAAHDKGVIHRDIKPANLWVEASTSRVKLLDFGITKRASGDQTLTSTGEVVGTPAYMAPEQARGLEVDARADLFSVGVVLHHMLGGQSPFKRDTYNATILAIATEVPPPAASFGVIPDKMAGLIDRLLAKCPDGRPATAKAALAVVLEVEQQLRSKRTASSGVAEMPVGAVPPIESCPGQIPEREMPEMTVRPIATPPPPPARQTLRLPPIEGNGSPVRPLQNVQPPVSPEKQQKRRRVWYGMIACGVAAVALIAATARLWPIKPIDSDDLAETTSIKSSGETLPPANGGSQTTLPNKEGGEMLPPKKSSVVVAPTGPKSASWEEVVEEFEYVIEGDTKKGRRRVVTLDIGGDETMEFVRIPKGTFMMGAPAGEKDAVEAEKPQRRVEITRDFYLGKYEVTQAQYKAVTGADPSQLKGGRLPVERVSWDDAVAFCDTLSGRWMRKVELPTEAQWEYSCRAGTSTSFHFGSKLNGDLANCEGNYPYGTERKGQYKMRVVKVGSYPANPWGLHDMHGNVREWCGDYSGPYDKIVSLIDPFQSIAQYDDRRIVRGGSWLDGAWGCRAAYRSKISPNKNYFNIGFRACLPLD
jgi:formylglycine-generating enzyme required for sulfatase activity